MCVISPITLSRVFVCFRFVSSIRDEIKAIIFRALPNLSEDTQTQMISTLQTLGVESREDLKFVEPEDIRDFLPATQQRKLLKEFKKGIYYPKVQHLINFG